MRKSHLFVWAVLLAAILVPTWATAGVDPPEVNVVLKPGESFTVTKTVEVPAVPPKLDLCLLIDTTGSYFDDLPVISGKVGPLFDDIRAEVADSQFCVANFRDFPFSAWGSAEDWAYQLNQDLTFDKDTWTSAIDLLTAGGGGDFYESQYEALYQMATGAGRDVPPVGASLGDIAPGANATFRADATKVIAITTDARFHTPGDTNCIGPSPCPFPYPGASRDVTVGALNAAGIKVIAIKAPGSWDEMDDLAAATGGAVVTTSDTSEEIAEAILAGLEALKQTITAVPLGCEPLLISFVPTSHADVTGPTTVSFEETIQVPPEVAPGFTKTCQVQFKADDTVIATQRVSVEVPLRGRMNGGGSFFTPDGIRVTHGFTMNCYTGRGGESLQVNWQGNSFHLEQLTAAACFDNPNIGEANPVAGFDTFQGRGMGRFNGMPGYRADWRFTDAGEPGRNDTAHLIITAPDATVILNASGNLRNGNHQALRD